MIGGKQRMEPQAAEPRHRYPWFQAEPYSSHRLQMFCCLASPHTWPSSTFWLSLSPTLETFFPPYSNIEPVLPITFSISMGLISVKGAMYAFFVAFILLSVSFH